MTPALPRSLPVFPLAGALLLPDGLLPLRIFEPRYVAMLEDVMAGNHLMGLIQPTGQLLPCGTPDVHKIGCAGEVVDCDAQPDGSYLVLLEGMSRFKITEEMAPLRGYRRMQVTWIDEPATACGVDRARFVPLLKKYLTSHQLCCDWEAITACPDDQLVTTLAMICPFSPVEQQALVEAADLKERTALLTSLLEMAGCEQQSHHPN